MGEMQRLRELSESVMGEGTNVLHHPAYKLKEKAHQLWDVAQKSSSKEDWLKAAEAYRAAEAAAKKAEAETDDTGLKNFWASEAFITGSNAEKCLLRAGKSKMWNR